MTYTGRMRVFFNRHGAAPLVWCIATEGWELAVSAVAINTATRTVYMPKSVPDDEDGKASAWLETYGTLRVDGSMATIDTDIAGMRVRP